MLLSQAAAARIDLEMCGTNYCSCNWLYSVSLRDPSGDLHGGLARELVAASPRSRDRIKASVEALPPYRSRIAVIGLIELFLIPLIERVYIAGAHIGHAGNVASRRFCAIALRTDALMGASLPAIGAVAKFRARRFMWGLLYGINTGGAVVGCILAGFFLCRDSHGYRHLTAVSINLIVAAVSYLRPADPLDSGTEEANRSMQLLLRRG